MMPLASLLYRCMDFPAAHTTYIEQPWGRGDSGMDPWMEVLTILIPIVSTRSNQDLISYLPLF